MIDSVVASRVPTKHGTEDDVREPAVTTLTE
jgi:hypothetical protein